MASRLHHVIIILYITQIVIGGYLFYYPGYLTHRKITATVIPREPSPQGILTFSSLNCTVRPEMFIWLYDEGLRENVIDHFNILFDISLIEEVSLEEQIFGFQIPYTVELNVEKLEVKGWSELESEWVTIDINDHDMYVAGNITFVYVTFIPLAGTRDLKIDFFFKWKGGIFQQTFSTYRLYIPISISQLHLFSEYFSTLNYTVNIPKFSGDLGVGIYLPADCRVVESIPPISGTSYGGGVPYNGEIPPIMQYIACSLSIGDYPESVEKVDYFLSDLIRIDFESRKDLDDYNRSLFGSGLWIGVGISNIIAGVFGALHSEMQRRLQK